MPRIAVTTQQLVAAIVAERAAFGSATVRGLAGRLGVSVGAVHNAVRRAVEEGVVDQGEGAGTLRVLDAAGATVDVALVLVVDVGSGRPLDVRLA